MAWSFIWYKLNTFYTWMFCAKSVWNWPSDYESVQCFFTIRYFAINSSWKTSMVLHLKNLNPLWPKEVLWQVWKKTKMLKVHDNNYEQQKKLTCTFGSGELKIEQNNKLLFWELNPLKIDPKMPLNQILLKLVKWF